MKTLVSLILAGFAFLLFSCQKPVENTLLPFELKISKSLLTFNSNAGNSDSFTIQSNTQWTIATDAETNATWLQLSTKGGSGNGRVVATMLSKNTGKEPRTAAITISPVGAPSVAPVSVTIVQNPDTTLLQQNQPQLSVDRTNINLGSNSGSIDSISIQSNSWWVVSKSASWLSVNTLSGNGNSHLLILANESNTGFSPRTATLTLSLSTGASVTPVTISVIQGAGGVNITGGKALGGPAGEQINAVIRTADGGSILAGYTRSNEGDVSGNHGRNDAWIIRLSASGNIVWQKALGGSGDDEATALAATADGNLLVAGYTGSSNGDVSANHGYDDAWVVKLDLNGNKLWQKSWGGSAPDRANTIAPSPDGGYVIGGYTYSNDGDVSGNHGGNGPDAWILKADANGNKQWQRSLGGTEWDEIKSISVLSNGECVAAGLTKSNSGDVSGNHGDYDAWVIKLGGNGNVQWQRVLGGIGKEAAYAVVNCADGGFAVAGYTNSNDGDVSGYHGNCDAWVVKLAANGATSWQKALGGSALDYATAMVTTADGGLVIAGNTQSNNGDVSANHGLDDAWAVKLGANGAKIWQRTAGGSNSDEVFGLTQTTNGDFLMAGATLSSDGDVSGNHGGGDAWSITITDSN